MKALIIGGSGLISTAITRALVEAGADLTLYTRGQRPLRAGAESAHQLTGDRHDYAAFEAQMAAAGPFDVVIDMITYTPEDAESTVRAFRGRAGQVIFTSTVDVYSKPAHTYPIREDEPRRGNNAYGRNKILCEDIFMAAHARSDFAATIIRPAFTYGEGGTLIDLFGWGTGYIDRIRKGKPLLVHGDGSSFWVACHVEDAARAFRAACTNPITYGRAYHIAGEEWLTWDRYYALLAEALDQPLPPLVHIPTDLLLKIIPQQAALLGENFAGNNLFDNSAARADLGFAYTIPWREGARRTVAWLDAHGGVAPGAHDALQDRLIAAWATAESAFAEAFRA